MGHQELCDNLISEFDVRKGAKEILDSFSSHTFDHPTSGPTWGEEMWVSLKKEVFQLLCTKSAKYRSERALLSVSAKPAIAILSAFLTERYGIAMTSAATIAAVALTIPLKLSVNSWCELHKGNNYVSDADIAYLKRLSED